MMALAYIEDSMIIVRLFNFSLDNYYVWAGLSISTYIGIVVTLR